MRPLLVASLAFALIFGGALLGTFLHARLPGHHLGSDTKDVVRLGAGLIATIAALVLGLLIGSANSTFGSQSGQIKQLTADIILLDNVLVLYGPETESARTMLRQGIAPLADRIWRESGSGSGNAITFEASGFASSFESELLGLSPRNETQRLLKAKALDANADMARTRLLLFTNAGQTLPMPFLVVLVSWLTIIFASFSLFAEKNALSIAALCIYALSASASLFLILELSQPFMGLMQIPSEPLRNALAPLGP
ncbi:conserved membrane hypothetical protein [Burkholderiales bacterium]|nr:conserved membrane hypothetical protein [Burkholderiales bacterium]